MTAAAAVAVAVAVALTAADAMTAVIRKAKDDEAEAENQLAAACPGIAARSVTHLLIHLRGPLHLMARQDIAAAERHAHAPGKRA